MKTRANQADAEPMLSVAEVAKALKVTEKTVRRLIDGGELPAYRVASKRLVRLHPRDVRALLHPVRLGANAPGDKRSLSDLI